MLFRSSKGIVEVGPVVVPLETDPVVELGLLLAVGPELDMVKETGGEPGVGVEPEQSEEELECGLRRGRTR